MIIAVTGGRDFNDRAWVMWALDRASSGLDDVQLVVGDASGVDTWARLWALERGHQVRVFVADWSTHGRAAGPIRNREMLDQGRPELLVAFPGGRGTADCIRAARERLIPVLMANRNAKGAPPPAPAVRNDIPSANQSEGPDMRSPA